MSPWLLFGRRVKKHSSRGKFFERLVNVLAMIGNPGKRANSVLLPLGREESKPGFCFRDAQFDPALFSVEGLVGDDRKAELIGVKTQRTFLVLDRNGHEFDLLNHSAVTFGQGGSAVEQQGMTSHKSLVHLKG